MEIRRMKTDDHPAISGKELKEVVAFGRTCSKNAYPNPSRAGCPDRARLRAMAHRDPSLKLDDLPIAHVVRCSPCFQEYMHFRHMVLFMRGLRITGASLALAVAFVTVWLFVKGQIGGRSEPSLSQQKQLQPLSGADNTHSAAPVEPLAMKIDLASFSPTRGDEENLEKRIHLPRRYLRLTLQMPLGMEPGEYLIQMRGPSGTVYFDAHAPGHIDAGTTSVEVDLDLAGATLGKSTLMIRPPGLSWRRYPAVIE
jgi:hypothetical protein